MSREQAERAVRHYFQPGNLTALRELALRRTAQRVDDQMVDYMRSHAIEGPGRPASACWSASRAGKAPATVRHAKRLADQLRAPWTAISVDTAGRALRGGDDSLAEAMRLARTTGGRDRF